MGTHIDPFERKILEHLRFILNNHRMKIEDLLEWSSHEPTVDKNIREGEVKVQVLSLGVFCAVSKSADKRVSGLEDTSEASGSSERSGENRATASPETRDGEAGTPQ